MVPFNPSMLDGPDWDDRNQNKMNEGVMMYTAAHHQEAITTALMLSY